MNNKLIETITISKYPPLQPLLTIVIFLLVGLVVYLSFFPLFIAWIIIFSIMFYYAFFIKQEFLIDQSGILFKKGKRTIFRFNWNELASITLGDIGKHYFSIIELNTHKGIKKYVTDDHFDYEELKTTYPIIKKYAEYYNIPFKKDEHFKF